MFVKGKTFMEQLSATQAKQKLATLIDEMAKTHQPIFMKGKRNKAVLINEDDWRSIQETLYLMSIPNMRESIIEGMNTPNGELFSEKEFYAELNKKDEPE